MMLKVKMKSGETRMVTARYYSQLMASGQAVDFDGKEEKAVIETKEEKQPKKRRTKNAT